MDAHNWHNEFQREKKKRVGELESAAHVFPPKLSPLDWSLAFLTIGASGLLLIVGAWV